MLTQYKTGVYSKYLVCDDMFAVIKSGGKQYKVALGSILKLERIEQKKNSDVLFTEVLNDQ